MIAAALIALGSLGLTVAAVVAAPQVVAFLGLTHYSAGLDRISGPAPDPVVGQGELAKGEPAEGGNAAALGSDPTVEPAEAPESPWVRGAATHPEKFRWMTIPMLGLIFFAVVIAMTGLRAAA